jgi:DNA-directed RNA polymerase subunit D
MAARRRAAAEDGGSEGAVEAKTMKLEFRKLTETSAIMVVDSMSPASINALRQTMIADIPKMAIEDVEFHLGPIRDADGHEYESISPLFDEILSHRLGMVPVPTDLDRFHFKDKCVCGGEGCPECSIMYTLNKKGPCIVYSGDLEPVGDSTLKVKEDLIPLVKLAEGQAPLIYATAVLGTGRQHSKWQLCHGVGVKYYPQVEIDAKKCDKGGSCVKNCPRDVFEKGEAKIVVKDEEACILCGKCMEVCELGAVKVKGDETKFVYRFETDGSVPAKKALEYALKLIRDKAEDFRNSVSAME